MGKKLELAEVGLSTALNALRKIGIAPKKAKAMWEKAQKNAPTLNKPKVTKTQEAIENKDINTAEKNLIVDAAKNKGRGTTAIETRKIKNNIKKNDLMALNKALTKRHSKIKADEPDNGVAERIEKAKQYGNTDKRTQEEADKLNKMVENNTKREKLIGTMENARKDNMKTIDPKTAEQNIETLQTKIDKDTKKGLGFPENPGEVSPYAKNMGELDPPDVVSKAKLLKMLKSKKSSGAEERALEKMKKYLNKK